MRDKEHHCVQCNRVLQDRYKGRQKKYCSDECRLKYVAVHGTSKNPKPAVQ